MLQIGAVAGAARSAICNKGGRLRTGRTVPIGPSPNRRYAVRMKIIGPLALALILVACGDTKPIPTPTEDGPLRSSVVPSALSLERMAAADRLDGTEDHVITRCPSCALRMSGKAEFSCQIGDYTIHSCSKNCNLQVCEDPDGVFADAAALAK